MSVRIAIEYGMIQSMAKKGQQDVSAAELAKEAGADEVITGMLGQICHCFLLDANVVIQSA